ncbi:MAG: M14 family zinc carboxypeptidase, partial [Nannocystaceae bacterium]
MFTSPKRPLPSLARASLLAGCFLLLQPLPAAASPGVPAYDAQRETVVFGRAIATATPKVPKATTRGDWQTTKGRLLATSQTPGQDPLWFPSSSAANLSDGLVRMRVAPGKKPDLTLLFRVQLDRGRLDGLAGYGLALEKETLRIYRWDRGKVREVGPAVKIKGLAKIREIEVVVYLIGPQFVALAFDGTTFKHLATLAAHDTTYPKGHIGMRSGPRSDGETAVTLVSVMPLGVTTGYFPRWQNGLWLPPLPPGLAPQYGPHIPDDTTPFGNQRYVYVQPSHTKKLPAALRRKRVATVSRRSGSPEDLLRLDLRAYERLVRTGVAIQAVSEEVPFADINQAYRAQRGKPPTPTARGFRIDESLKNATMVEALVRGYHARYPKITKLEELGRSHQGRPLLGLKISKNPGVDEDEPVVLLNAAHHGSELLPVEYALDAMQQLLEGYGRDPQATRWVNNLEIWCVPMVNPDGNHMYMEVSRDGGRKNGRDTDRNGTTDPFEGVDLNRNYPFGWGRGGEVGSRSFFTHKWYRGPAPASEPETQ